MERGEAEDGLLGDGLVVGEERGDEAALAALRQRDRLVEGVVGHDGRDRAEGLDVVDGGGGERRAAEEDDRVQEGALLGVAGGERDLVGVAGYDLGLGGELADALADLAALVEAGERAHAGGLVGGVAEGGLGQAVAEGGDDGVGEGAGGDDAADRGALLAGLDGHLAGDLADEEVEFGRAGAGVGAEDRGVEAVGLHGEAGGVLDDRRVGLELAPRRGRAGEGDGVLAGDVVEQVAGRAGDELEGALRQDAGFDDAADDELGQVGGLARRLRRSRGRRRSGSGRSSRACPRPGS